MFQSVSQSPHEALQAWRRQIGCRTRLAERRGPRPFCLVTYCCSDLQCDSLVPINRLLFVSLFDERGDDDRLRTRLLGFRVSFEHQPVVVGGSDRNLFEKDLRVPPRIGGGHCHLDAADPEWSQLALHWESFLERCQRHPHFPRRATLRWPEWWCSIHESTADLPTRLHRGESLIRLENAQRYGKTIRKVFADLSSFPKRQVIPCEHPAAVLCDGSDSLQFDLYHSRFRRAS